MKYFALLTKLGENLLAQATALGTKLELTHMAVGDGGGSLPTPDTNQTKLIKEQRRAAINTLFIDEQNKNQIIAEQIIPEAEGGWWIREIGLFDKAGNLIAVANCPETYKPQLAEGSGRTQSIRMVLIVSHTESVTLKIDPSVVLATREYVNTEITVLDKKIDALSAQTKLDLSKKIDKANITNQTGNSTELVASQQLLTTEAGKKASKEELNNGLALKFDKTGGVVSGDISATGDISSTAGKAIVKLETKGEKTTLVSNLGNGYRAHILQDKSGTLAHHGDFGIGTSMNGVGMTNIHDANTFNDTGCVASGADSINFFANLSPLFSMIRNGGADGTGFVTQIQGDGKTRIAFRQRERGTWRGWYEFLTEANTTKDANGFVRTGTATAITTSDITQTTGGYSNKVMSQEATTNAINAIKMLGNGQKWTDVKSGRQSGVNYINSTGRTIAISVATPAANAPSSLVIYVDGVTCSSYYVGGNSSDISRQSIGSAIIPAGSTYRVDVTSIGIWAELR